jgi:hypothetical protein
MLGGQESHVTEGGGDQERILGFDRGLARKVKV